MYYGPVEEVVNISLHHAESIAEISNSCCGFPSDGSASMPGPSSYGSLFSLIILRIHESYSFWKNSDSRGYETSRLFFFEDSGF